MLPKGTTFLRNRHIWFNLTEPTEQTTNVLCVNLTTLDEECPDRECIISAKDYKGIGSDHPTAVAFSRAKLWDSQKIILCLANGTLKQAWGGDIPIATVELITVAALKSAQLNGDFKRLL